jgi:hypothetical protein
MIKNIDYYHPVLAMFGAIDEDETEQHTSEHPAAGAAAPQ